MRLKCWLQARKESDRDGCVSSKSQAVEIKLFEDASDEKEVSEDVQQAPQEQQLEEEQHQ